MPPARTALDSVLAYPLRIYFTSGRAAAVTAHAGVTRMADGRFVIIHGHFYQPPRESPWTGLISPEPGAPPFQNWNDRILSECYAANAHAQVAEGSVIHVSNNYEKLNFDFGPTLMSWMERHGKSAYREVLRGDKHSAEAHEGRGNAMAQGFS